MRGPQYRKVVKVSVTGNVEIEETEQFVRLTIGGGDNTTLLDLEEAIAVRKALGKAIKAAKENPYL